MLRDFESGDSDQLVARRLVITGASGFVGSNLCRYLAERGAEVWAVAGPSGHDWRLQGLNRCRRVNLDLTERASVHTFIAEAKPDAVINCAAYGAYASQADAERIYAVNFHSVRHLLEAIRVLPRRAAFVQAGSSSEYGRNCAGPSEDARTVPDSEYAVSKVAATALVQYYATSYGVPAWVLRLYSVYGPFEDLSRLVPQLLQHAREGKYPRLVDPSVSRDFVFVHDVCEAVAQTLIGKDRLPPGEIYNIGSGTHSTIGELVGLVRRLFRVPGDPVWGSMQSRSWDHCDWFANPRKANETLGWRATTSMEEGLLATMKWLDANPALVAEAAHLTVLHQAAS